MRKIDIFATALAIGLGYSVGKEIYYNVALRVQNRIKRKGWSVDYLRSEYEEYLSDCERDDIEDHWMSYSEFLENKLVKED